MMKSSHAWKSQNYKQTPSNTSADFFTVHGFLVCLVNEPCSSQTACSLTHKAAPIWRNMQFSSVGAENLVCICGWNWKITSLADRWRCAPTLKSQNYKQTLSNTSADFFTVHGFLVCLVNELCSSQTACSLTHKVSAIWRNMQFSSAGWCGKPSLYCWLESGKYLPSQIDGTAVCW